MKLKEFVRTLVAHHFRGPAIAGLASLALLSGCGGGGSDASPTPPTSTVATVKGRVFNAQDGTPISGATVKAGTATATSASDGTYEITSVTPGDRIALVAEAANYADNLKITSAAANTTATVDIKLLKAGVTTQINSTTGGTVTVPSSTAQVALPANFAANADGSAATGNVSVKVTPIGPALDSTLMPGDYLTATSSGNASIESFGALAVTLNSSTGAPLNLATGKTATIRIPLSTRSSSALPATIPLFFLSPQTGLWVQEGSASLRGTAPNQYYEGTVTHFSTWNADQVINTISVTGTVKDDLGAVVSGVTLRCDGIDYSGSSTAVSDANGRFTIKMKLSGLCTLAGYIGNKFTNDVRVGPSAIDFPLATTLVLAAASNNVKIKLTWGANPSDVDSYLTLPTGEVLYYSNDGNLLAAPFANLDVDDTSSFGPEVMTIRKLMVGTYKYAVRNYSGTNSPGITGSPTKVELTVGSNTSVYAPPAGEPASGNTVWSVLNLTVSSNCTVTVATIGAWSLVEPTTTAGSAATYCVAP
jgi:Carboxypeptidase regulatory-like domain